MKKNIFIILSGIIFLFFSCENPKRDNTVKTNEVDLFREDALKMKRAGMFKNVSDKELDSLISVYEKDNDNGMKLLLAATGDMVYLRVGLNGRTPDEVYKGICDTIGKRYPDLAGTNVRCTYLPEFDGGKDTGWIMLQQDFGKATYKRKLYYFRDWQIDNALYRLYNAYLADSSKNVRLYEVDFNCTHCDNQPDFIGRTDVSRFGILRLTKQQADTLMTIPELHLDPEQQEFSMFTSQQVQNQLKKFESSGLLTAKDNSWYDRTRDDVLSSTIYKQEDLFDFFDTIIGSVTFDTINDYNPYQEILHRLSRVSRGNFVPDVISDEPSHDPSMRIVRFSMNGKIFEYNFQLRGDLFQPSVIDSVNAALAQMKAGGAFYSVLTRDKEDLLLFVPDKIAGQVKKSGFFPEFDKGASPTLKDWYAKAGQLQ